MQTEMEWGSKPEFFGPKHLFRENIVLSKAKKYFKDGKLLDAGFGNGSLIIQLSKNKDLEIYGIDASKKFIDYTKLKLKNAHLYLGDVTDLKFNENYFDYLVSTEVLEHVEQDKKAVKEFYRVLKKNGLCIITVPIDPKSFDHTDKWAGHFRKYTPEQLNQLFKEQGFKLIDSKKFSFILLRLYHILIYRKVIRTKKVMDKNPLIRFISLVLSKFFLLDYVFQIGSPQGFIAVYRK